MSLVPVAACLPRCRQVLFCPCLNLIMLAFTVTFILESNSLHWCGLNVHNLVPYTVSLYSFFGHYLSFSYCTIATDIIHREEPRSPMWNDVFKKISTRSVRRTEIHSVTDSAVTRPELWRFFNIYSMIFHDWHLLNNYNSLTKADTLNLNTAYESLYLCIFIFFS